MPSGAYTLLGAVIGAAITLLTTWTAQRWQRKLEQKKIEEARADLLYKERAEKVYQFATDLGAAAYAFVSITWCAEHEAFDQEEVDNFSEEIRPIMPRLYASYAILAGLDDDLEQVAGSLVDRADELDTGIGEAVIPFHEGESANKVAALRQKALDFSHAASEELAAQMKKKRIVLPARTQRTT